MNYNSSKLNTWEMKPLELAGTVKSERLSPDKSDHPSNKETPSQTAKLKDVKKQNKSSMSSAAKEKKVKVKSPVKSDPDPTNGLFLSYLIQMKF